MRRSVLREECANRAFPSLWRSERGMAIGVTFIVMMITLALGVIYLNSVMREKENVGEERKKVQGHLSAENAIHRIVNNFRTTQDTNSDGQYTDAPVGGNVDASGMNYNDMDADGTNDFNQVFIAQTNLGSEANPIVFGSGAGLTHVWVEALTSGNGTATIHAIGAPDNPSAMVSLDATITLSLLGQINAPVNNAS
ncbi:MAG TPA: hypothetical protein EYN18_01650 [Nitrospirales bacterium]|nr:hypothetical protein [Nitrospirales bacterium]